jgi:HEAT repeat protein
MKNMKTQTLTLILTIGLAGSAAAQTTVAETAAAARAAAADARVASTVVREALAAQTTIARIPEIVEAARAAAADARVATTVAQEAFSFAFAGRGWEQTSAQREQEEAQREKERAQREKERENNYYDQGQQSLDQARWDRAVTSFDRVIEMKGAKSDAALYWKAYAQNKLGQRPEALASINLLLKDYSKSRYLGDAKALEVEVKRLSNSPIDPAAQTDEEMKILAINALQNSAPEEAIPMLQKVLQGTGSPKLKAQALFVLAQSNSPRAREVLVNIAKTGNPDLQTRAVRYLGIHGGRESRAALADIYASFSDVDLKKRILSAFMQGGEKDRLLTAAQTEQNAELRAAAVQYLGNMGAQEELWAMYQKEASVDVKKGIIRALFTGGGVTRLAELARGEQNPELRLLAVKNLAVMGSKRTGDTLIEIYNSDKNVDVRRAIISGLANGGNSEALVALARKEQDLTLKKEMVQRLSQVRGSKVVTDFLLELINK